MEMVQSANKSYLLTGGNMGNRAGYLRDASVNISFFCGKILRQSSLYETQAWGKTNQPNFFNQVLLIETTLCAVELMKKILLIEEKMGRTRNEKYGSRIIDIDILFFNDEMINKPQLVVPHPEIQNRRFALAPMNEIAPDFIHPVLLKNISTLLKECGDKLGVKKI
ncbi:MAG TPA: 2-amino-4-hydroxy-6-hydroxymethyldihydropteridine diphosphokinase [Puia sp.]|nr:2-amino-4-hydroxy-6-hydroxymethyldihydropteridine diphosphokinase [Puia sp.]